MGLYTLLQVLCVLFASVARLKPAGQLTLKNDINRLVSSFMLPPELISKAVDIATVISQLEAGENNLKQYQKNIDGWAVEIIQVSELDLSSNLHTSFKQRSLSS